MLRRTPVFATAAILTIAIAIGANTAIFSVVNWALLRPTAGVVAEDRLATVTLNGEMDGGISLTFGAKYPDYLTYRAKATRVSGVMGYQQLNANLGSTAEAGAQRVHGELVTDNYFQVLGTRPLAGRLLDSTAVRSPAVVVLSERMWRRAFGGDRDIIGKTASINGQKLTIIGVAQHGFVGVDPFNESDLWFPIEAGATLDPENNRTPDQQPLGRMVVRVRDGVQLADVSAEAKPMITPQNLSFGHMKVRVEARAGIGLPDESKRQLLNTMLLLMTGVGLVLLIACANVANLFLARGATRVREVALRRSLGASDWALGRQLVAESLVVSLVAGGLGIIIALWGTSLLEGFRIDQNMQALPAVPVDVRVVGFAVLLSIVTAALFALPPVVGTLRSDSATLLRSGSRGSAGRSRVQGALVILQVAFSFVLVVGAGLFLRTVNNLRNIDLGFRPENVIGVSMDLSAQGYANDRVRPFLRQLEERLRSRPQIEAVATSAVSLFGGIILSHPEPEFAKPMKQRDWIGANMVTPGYFKTIGVPLLRGRDFAAADLSRSDSADDVVIVNQTLAKEFWPNRDPIGQRMVLKVGPKTSRSVVVGVVGDSRSTSPRRPPDPFYYSPLTSNGSVTVLVRSKADKATLVSEIRREVAALDPNLPIYDVLTIAERIDQSFAEQRSSAGLTSIFGIVGMLLAAIGLYAVISFTVLQRTRELAIRVALGAQDGQIKRNVIGDAVRLVVVGVVLGGAAAFGLAKLLTTRLYGVTGTDVPTFAIVSLTMLMLAVLASYAPARRATRLDPMLALRSD